MSMVTLVSGGVDSTLMAVLAREEGLTQYPLFVDYGQLCKDAEWKACSIAHDRYGLPKPIVMNLSGFGKLIASGLTSASLRINEDAFLPGRNLLFLLAGCAYAYQVKAKTVGIGVLSEEFHIFPDQTGEFLRQAESAIQTALGYAINIVAPLMKFNKSEVLELARQKGISGTYSCHSGQDTPCGICVSCLEIKNAEVKGGV